MKREIAANVFLCCCKDVKVLSPSLPEEIVSLWGQGEWDGGVLNYVCAGLSRLDLIQQKVVYYLVYQKYPVVTTASNTSNWNKTVLLIELARSVKQETCNVNFKENEWERSLEFTFSVPSHMNKMCLRYFYFCKSQQLSQLFGWGCLLEV